MRPMSSNTSRVLATSRTPTSTPPAYLCVLLMVDASKSRFKPTVKAMMERYYKKYRGKGGIEPGEAGDPLLSGEAGPSTRRTCPRPSAGTCLSTHNCFESHQCLSI